MDNVIRLNGEGPESSGKIPAPPAPDPVNGVSRTWAELFDTLLYLADEGELAKLRQQLMTYAQALGDVPLPAEVFDMGDTPGGGA